MFSFAPHSCQLSHLDSSLCSSWEYGSPENKQHSTETKNTINKPRQRFESTESTSENENIVTPQINHQSGPSSPTTFSGLLPDDSSLSPDQSLVVLSQTVSTDSALSSQTSSKLQAESSSYSEEPKSTSSLVNSPQSPSDMLSPAHRISSFQFVEFTALHETNVVHRLPSSNSDSLLSPPIIEDIDSQKFNLSSPRKTSTRSRRRCKFCGGLIQFADRKVANGQHWHQQCFKCATCGRFLDPGKHQENTYNYCISEARQIRCQSAGYCVQCCNYDGQPYCKSCFTLLTQTHPPVMPPQSPQEKNDIISRIKDYNLYKDTTPADSIKHKEVGDSNLVYEGVIKLYWGLKRHITLSSGHPVYKQQRGPRESLYNYVSIDDDGFQRMFENAQKNNDVMPRADLQELMGLSENGVDTSNLVTHSLNDATLLGMRDTGNTIPEEQTGEDYILSTQSDGEFGDDSDSENDYENVIPLRNNVIMRQKSDHQPNRGTSQIGLKRRSTSFKKVQRQRRQTEDIKRSKFIPPYGKPTNLRVSSIQGTVEVISMLLQKYKVENPPSAFALFVMHDNGAIEVLDTTDSPLAVRLKLGPSEDVAKIYIMESGDAEKLVSHETAEYIKFQLPELKLFLTKYNEEEERELIKLKKRFETWFGVVREQLQSLKNENS